MKITRRDFITSTAAGLVLLGTGMPAHGSGDVEALLKKAEDQIMQGDDKGKVLELIATYERVLQIEPDNYEALWSLGRYRGLVGMAYSDTVEEKRGNYSKAVEYCLRGLRTNPDFKKLMDSGQTVAQACRATSRREIAALFYWNTCKAAIWKECSTPLQQLAGVKLLPASRKIMTRMMEIDPEWAGGHPYHAWAVFYTILPRVLGGNMKKAAQYYEKAIEAGPHWLYIRHGRAEYYHAKRRDWDAYIEDLEWVIAQDPKTADSPYPANVYYQKTAKEMVANVRKKGLR